MGFMTIKFKTSFQAKLLHIIILYL